MNCHETLKEKSRFLISPSDIGRSQLDTCGDTACGDGVVNSSFE